MKTKPILLSLALIAPMVFSCKKNSFAEAWQVASMQVQMAEVNGSISKLEQADEALKSDIKALEQAAVKLQIDIESSESSIARVEGEMDEADAAIRGDIAAFRAKAQAKLDSVNTVLNGLKAKDTALEGQIASLKSYTDEKLGQTRDWASETFTTKEQYATMMSEITTIKGTINTLSTSLTSLTTSVTQLQTPLAEIQTQLLSLLGRVEGLEDNLAQLISRIQSVVVLPDYADGSVSCSSGYNRFQFEVLPSGMANLLAQAPVTAFTMKAMYTKTKALSFVPLSVLTVEADGDLLIVTASGAQLSQDFFAGTSSANASLQIQSGLSHYSTVYFPLYRASVAPPPEPLDIETDLSATATANCYIVAAAGKYKFNGTVKGNSTTALDGTPISAALLWESFGTSTAPSVNDIIATLSYEDGFVKFETPSTLKNGNAVVAVKDASGNILWSWHIWVCAGYDPIATSQVYYNYAGTMMDRNLGSTSVTPGNVRTLGLLFQWGRKDPFLGSSGISSNTKAASTIDWPEDVVSDSNKGTIAYAVSHPTTFIKCNSDNSDWYYTGSTSVNNSRWKSSKTIYDPCPAGWKVPVGGANGVWASAIGDSASFTHHWNSQNKGMFFSGLFGPASSIWYPAAGWMISNTTPNSVGSQGVCWSCTPNGKSIHILKLLDTGKISPIAEGLNHRYYGYSVRCIHE